jgi:hypothetical protein
MPSFDATDSAKDEASRCRRGASDELEEDAEAADEDENAGDELVLEPGAT